MKQPFIERHIEYFQELRPHLNTITVLLGIGIVAGVFMASSLSIPRLRVVEPLSGIAQVLLGLPKPFLALSIFLNNGLKTFLVVVLGLVCGVVPVVFVLANGFAIGFLLRISTQSIGLSGSLLAVAPHGVFELPGVVLGASVGLMLGHRAIKRLFGKGEIRLPHELGRGLRFFWGVVLPLLLLGALVEAFVTSALVSR